MGTRGKRRDSGVPISFSSWRPGASDSERSTGELVGDFLLVTEALPREEVARIAGVSTGTLSRWQRTPGHSLGKETRRRIQRYLAGHDQEPRPAPSAQVAA